MAGRISRLAVAMRLIAALALTMIGFAHQPLVANPLALQLAAYVLPDGTLPTFCLNDDGSQQPPGDGKGTIHDHGCDACRLSASVLTPTPPDLDGRSFEFAAIQRAVEADFQLARALYPPNSGPRAPPRSAILA